MQREGDATDPRDRRLFARLLRVARGSAVTALCGWYLWSAFSVGTEAFWTSGLGDWVDPYFINALLENWYRSVLRLADPSSPLMYFPAKRTLGYSHGLILYAPLYIAVRLFAHPFFAYNLSLLIVIATGSLSLYALLRTWTGLAFLEALTLTAFFATSANIITGATGIWSQRASVFLIPPILLIAIKALRTARPRARNPLAFATGLLGILLFTQDFYTAQFALMLTVFLLAPFMPFLLPRVTSPAMLPPRLRDRAFIAWFCAGCAVGIAVFIHIYLRAYREHHIFPEEHLLNSLTTLDTSGWQNVMDAIRFLGAFETLRPFGLVLAAAVLAWVPGFGVDRRTRLYVLWFTAISAVVLLAPLRIHDFSIWKSVLARFPGSSIIRDPRRIIYLYELAVVLAGAIFLSRLPRRLLLRIAVTGLAIALLVSDWNRHRFEYGRPIETFRQWVEAPIDIDPRCRSFFILGASDRYMARSFHMWALYNVDSMFVSFAHALPTLNGYSAWSPGGWELANPQEDTYLPRVRHWIAARRPQAVCAFDIEARTMRPFDAPE